MLTRRRNLIVAGLFTAASAVVAFWSATTLAAPNTRLSASCDIVFSSWFNYSELKDPFADKPANDELDGLVSTSVPFSLNSIYHAYSNGIFSWGDDGHTAVWYSPPLRGVLTFDHLHVSKSYKKWARKNTQNHEDQSHYITTPTGDKKPKYEVRFNTDFQQTVRNAFKAHSSASTDADAIDDLETWITSGYMESAFKLHRLGMAKSVEVWNNQTEQMVGGLYGFFIDGVFAGESMFSFEANTSKMAFYALVERLKAKGHTFIDIQQVIEPYEDEAGNQIEPGGVTFYLGGENIPRDDFLDRLRKQQSRRLPF